LPKTFRQYEIQDKIGSGGMASVYKGQHSLLGSPVAIKVLHRELAFDQMFISRFEREARSAASIQNPNIVKVLDYGSEDEVYFIVMEYVDGPDLGHVFQTLGESPLATSAFPAEICLLILHDVAFGLRAAHQMGIFHRDIKPSNLILDMQGLVRIGDFGLARGGQSSRDMDLTLTGTVIGTPSYMSPEQAAGEPLDHRTDIFSLGVVAYKLLTGNKPFDGTIASEVQQQIITVDPPSLDCEKFPWFTPEIRDFLDRCLEKDPTKRFADMDQVLKGIRVCQESLDSEGRVALNKYDFLANFASDPVEFTQKFQKESAKRHLKKALHFKNMGVTRLDDALHEFQYVIALNPNHTQALEGIRELKKNKELEESSEKIPPLSQDDSEATTVMPSHLALNFEAPNEKPKEPPRKPPPTPAMWAMISAVLVVVFLGVWGISMRGGVDEAVDPPHVKGSFQDVAIALFDTVNEPVEDPIVEDETEDLVVKNVTEPVTESIKKPEAEPDPKPKTTAPVVVAEAKPKPITPKPDKQPEPKKKIVPTTGMVRVKVDPAVDIYLDDKMVCASTSEFVVSASKGKHTLRLQNDQIYLRRELPVQISGGETLQLDPVTFPLGDLHLGTNALTARVEVDGIEVSHRWPIPAFPIAAGDHIVTVRASGAPLLQVISFSDGVRKNLVGSQIENGVWRIPIVVIEGEKTRIQMKFNLH